MNLSITNMNESIYYYVYIDIKIRRKPADIIIGYLLGVKKTATGIGEINVFVTNNLLLVLIINSYAWT